MPTWRLGRDELSPQGGRWLPLRACVADKRTSLLVAVPALSCSHYGIFLSQFHIALIAKRHFRHFIRICDNDMLAVLKLVQQNANYLQLGMLYGAFFPS